MWTDAHIHLYDTRRTSVCWPPMELGLPQWVYVPDFLAQADKSGISRMVSVECTVGGPEEVDNWTLTLTRNDPAVAAVIASADMTLSDFESVHGRFLAFPKYRGIRVFSVAQERLSAFRESLAVMGKTSANVVELLMEPQKLLELKDAMAENPDVTFILNHIPGCTVGGAPQSQETLDFLGEIAAIPNVYMKVSSFVTKSPEKPAPADAAYYAAAFEACMNAFGTKRCIYGSDWPVLEFKGTYDTNVRAITQWLHPYGMDVTDDVMGNNCEQAYHADMSGV